MSRPWRGAVRALRWLAGRPLILPLTALLLRARTVRPSVPFVLRELLRRRGVRVYRLRENGLRVAIRHGTGDVVTLGEVFHEHDYRPEGAAELGLGTPATIVDLGANIGLFGAYAAARWPAATIVGFEPDPENASVHERTIALNGLQARWQLVRAAAAAAEGSVSFVAGQAAISHIAGAPGEPAGARAAPGEAPGGAADPAAETIEVRTQDVLGHLARADLAKIDIEGGEWTILADQRFRQAPPRALVLEYHPRFCPGRDPRAEAEAAIRAAGLHVQPLWHRADGHGMLWAWRT